MSGEEKSREDLVSNVSESLQSLTSDDPDWEISDIAAEGSESEESERSESGSEGDSEEQETEDTVESGEGEEAASSEDEPTLPDAHVRSLKAYGWTDDEIEQAVSADPDNFAKTAEKIHENRTKETAAWAELGRKKRQEQASAPADSSTDQTAQPDRDQPATTPDGRLTPVDVDALKKEYGDDELVDRLAQPVNQTIEQINAMLPVIQQAQQAYQMQQQQALEREVESFFSAESMNSYRDLYGPSFRDASEEQANRRRKVLETADAIVVGAKAQGRDLSVQEAMAYAHEIESADFRQQAARESVQKKVQKRSKSITQRPAKQQTSTSADSEAGKPVQDRNELQSRVRNRLKKVGLA